MKCPVVWWISPKRLLCPRPRHPRAQGIGRTAGSTSRNLSAMKQARRDLRSASSCGRTHWSSAYPCVLVKNTMSFRDIAMRSWCEQRKLPPFFWHSVRVFFGDTVLFPFYFSVCSLRSKRNRVSVINLSSLSAYRSQCEHDYSMSLFARIAHASVCHSTSFS